MALDLRDAALVQRCTAWREYLRRLLRDMPAVGMRDDLREIHTLLGDVESRLRRSDD
jgi:hypothetical protein